MKSEADIMSFRGYFDTIPALRGSLGGSDGLFSVFVNQFN